MPRSSSADLVPVGDWLRSRRPFRQLRSALLDAEAFLNGYQTGVAGAAWRQVRDRAGDDAAVVEAIDLLLHRLSPRPRVRLGAAGPGLFLESPGATRELGAVCAVVVLNDLSGGVRVKRCGRADCDRVFLDWTNPNNRVACRYHPADGAECVT
ncbi:CGNR zinc finger domain-containing protein [Saccharothrix variisporea]|uniref:RagB/SusD family nutrient uptake outer membrane protein n=1 Tax=Saccharothrix variisporea TaxID=543527 RepID=UPI0011C3F75F|nr:RagB/SusD family nutrient uptake outer membrane protein [Saccharothrix variisporea]